MTAVLSCVVLAGHHDSVHALDAQKLSTGSSNWLIRVTASECFLQCCVRSGKACTCVQCWLTMPCCQPWSVCSQAQDHLLQLDWYTHQAYALNCSRSAQRHPAAEVPCLDEAPNLHVHSVPHPAPPSRSTPLPALRCPLHPLQHGQPPPQVQAPSVPACAAPANPLKAPQPLPHQPCPGCCCP